MKTLGKWVSQTIPALRIASILLPIYHQCLGVDGEGILWVNFSNSYALFSQVHLNYAGYKAQFDFIPGWVFGRIKK